MLVDQPFFIFFSLCCLPSTLSFLSFFPPLSPFLLLFLFSFPSLPPSFHPIPFPVFIVHLHLPIAPFYLIAASETLTLCSISVPVSSSPLFNSLPSSLLPLSHLPFFPLPSLPFSLIPPPFSNPLVSSISPLPSFLLPSPFSHLFPLSSSPLFFFPLQLSPFSPLSLSFLTHLSLLPDSPSTTPPALSTSPPQPFPLPAPHPLLSPPAISSLSFSPFSSLSLLPVPLNPHSANSLFPSFYSLPTPSLLPIPLLSPPFPPVPFSPPSLPHSLPLLPTRTRALLPPSLPYLTIRTPPPTVLSLSLPPPFSSFTPVPLSPLPQTRTLSPHPPVPALSPSSTRTLLLPFLNPYAPLSPLLHPYPSLPPLPHPYPPLSPLPPPVPLPPSSNRSPSPSPSFTPYPTLPPFLPHLPRCTLSTRTPTPFFLSSPLTPTHNPLPLSPSLQKTRTLLSPHPSSHRTLLSPPLLRPHPLPSYGPFLETVADFPFTFPLGDFPRCCTCILLDPACSPVRLSERASASFGNPGAAGRGAHHEPLGRPRRARLPLPLEATLEVGGDGDCWVRVHATDRERHPCSTSHVRKHPALYPDLHPAAPRVPSPRGCSATWRSSASWTDSALDSAPFVDEATPMCFEVRVTLAPASADRHSSEARAFLWHGGQARPVSGAVRSQLNGFFNYADVRDPTNADYPVFKLFLRALRYITAVEGQTPCFASAPPAARPSRSSPRGS
ncbi:hypothetical protein C7M84_005586 [Penaeus vannamei]|uniref:Uncharacterized protein n=1 Tax=Penaeus vannamei TaxID=6689 RepID=A0A3R7M9Q6_PENVA|nr:hypothetical protein C7M84_005586 [Penaeus vannamei]